MGCIRGERITIRISHLLFALAHVLEVTDNLVTQILQALELNFQRLQLLSFGDLLKSTVVTHLLWQWWLTHSSFDTYIVVVLRFNTVLQIESNFSVDSLTSCKKYPKPSNTFCLTARSWARWVTNREWLGFRSKLQTCRTLQWWMQICLSLRHPSDTRCVLSNPAPITRDVELSF